MATESFFPETKEYHVLKRKASRLQKVIGTNPTLLSIDLFSVDLISYSTLQKVNAAPATTPDAHSYKIIDNLLQAMVVDPNNFHKLLEVLENHPPLLTIVAKEMKEDYESFEFESTIDLPEKQTKIRDQQKEIIIADGRSIQRGYDRMRGKLAGLVLHFQKVVEKANVNFEDLKQYVIFYHPDEQYRDELRKARDTYEVFDVIRSKYCSLFNYDILLRIAERFDLPDGFKVIQEYEAEEDNYRKLLSSSTLARELQRENELLRQNLSHTKKIVLRIQRWARPPAPTVAEFQEVIKDVFADLGDLLHLLVVIPGPINHIKATEEEEEIEVVAINELSLLEQEKQYLKEKQILTDNIENLKEKISEKDKVIAKIEELSQNEKQIITEQEMELQRHIQSLRQELQVAHQNKVSLQEALTEANNQREGMTQVQRKLIEEKHIITEHYEKLKLKVADINGLLEEKTQAGEQYLKEKQIIIGENQNLKTEILEKDKVIVKLTSQVEEQSQNEKQIITDLRAKVSDNELYATKLMKEKSQLQERVTSLEEQSIKETSSKEVQFDYMIPSMDKLDCLNDVQVVEEKLFLIQGDKPQLMNWEKYGVRIGVQEGSLLSSETAEAAVVALVGGQFQFPPNTVLVSAVYAVSLSKPLLKRLKLEIQHCVDLTGRPALSRYLKFAIAPVSTPSLPYQFSIVEGGEFKPDTWYGSIQRNKFCLVSIVGEKHVSKSSTNGDNGDKSEEEEEQMKQDEQEGQDKQEGQEEQAEEETEEEVEDGDSDSSSDSDKTKDPPGGSSGGQGESTSNEGVDEERETGGQPLHEEGNEEQDNGRVEESKDHEEATAPIPCTEISSNVNSKIVANSTGIVDNMAYAGLVYYEKKEAEDLVTFAAAKDLNALLEFIKKDYPRAEKGQNILFHFKDYNGCIELKFDAPQEKPFTGWTIEPHLKPCRFLRCDVDKFGEANYPLPSTCLISVYGSPGAVSSLHYSIPLDGVVDPKTLFIHRPLRTTPLLPSPSTINVVHESTSVSSAGGASPSATVDHIKRVKAVIDDVLVSHYDTLTSLTKSSYSNLANKLYAAGLISEGVKEKCTMEEFLGEFRASFGFKKELSQVQEHCQKFLSSFVALRGSYADAGKYLSEEWIKAIRNKLGFDFNIDT